MALGTGCLLPILYKYRETRASGDNRMDFVEAASGQQLRHLGDFDLTCRSSKSRSDSTSQEIKIKAKQAHNQCLMVHQLP